MRKVAPPSNRLRAAFAEEYIVDKKVTASAVRAGYAEKGAAQAGSAAMKDPEVIAYIEYRLKQLANRANVTAERVLAEYAKIAFANVGDLYDAEGALVPVHELDEDVTAAIGSIEVASLRLGDKDPKKAGARSVTTKIKMNDKKGALDSIARHLGMFQDKVDVNHTGNVTLQISNADAEL